MSRRPWLYDSIARRFALAIGGAGAVMILLNILLDLATGGPPLSPIGLLDKMMGVVKRVEATPLEQRDSAVGDASTDEFRVGWFTTNPPVAPHQSNIPVGTVADNGLTLRSISVRGTDQPRQTVPFIVASLDDGTWLTFTPRNSDHEFLVPNWWILRVCILLFSVFAVSLIGASRIARPIEAFAAAARRFGTDPNAPPMPKQGPAEMQTAIDAFNAMQAQIQRFISGQAAMFAAVSHDLRTPLTRMRLRGEFIEDPKQQARLFRDVDEMQAMVDAALMFLRDNAAAEATTRLNLAELLRSIVDDCADAEREVSYSGPTHLAYTGRPLGLRRAFGNLVDNATKYGGTAAIELEIRDGDVQITILDRGLGIPPNALETVFAPFQRLEPSRSRDTGGMGLGLTSARAAFRAHGGDVTLTNRIDGGLRATVILPRSTDYGLEQHRLL